MGGAEACLLDALAVLRQARPEWKLSVVLGEDGPLSRRAAIYGAEVYLLPFPADLARLGDSGRSRSSLAVRLLSGAPSALRYRHQLGTLFRSMKPDLIHTNGFKMHVLAALAKPHESGLVWHIHDYVSSREVMAKLMRRLSSRTDAIITNSRHVAEDTRSIVGDAANIVPILNVVDLEEFTPEGPVLDVDRLSGFPTAPAGTIRVGLMATLAWWKGHRLFLQGLAGLDRALPVRGYYIGGALYKTQSQESLDDLRRFAKQLGLGDHIGFTGVVSKPAAVMRVLDVVVHSSTEPEPFGRVIAEAMACGKAVITAGLGGAAEIVAGNQCALTFDVKRPESLTEAITKLAEDAGLRNRLGSNGLSTARRDFGRERLARELPPVYEEVLSRVHGTKFTRAAGA
ncbi:MAG TPA: glycosyltransferase family 4 protein [Terriglobales bacterium]|nr:glycosyltransferase family 4 protein [Terriglobales bacterium]